MSGDLDSKRQALIRELVPDAIRDLSVYHVPDASGYIKLDAMENPYALPPELMPGLLKSLASVEVNRYPDAAATLLKSRLRKAFDIPQDVQLVMGNGSDELIMLLVVMLGGAGRTVLAPSPSFSMYRQISLFTGTNFHTVPLKQDFALDHGAMMDAIRVVAPSCVFLAYPNNPTGNYFEAEQVREIIRAAPGLVVLDEAYYPFGGCSFMDEIEAFPNLVVMRTLSKSGFAGLRMGILAAPSAWAEEFEKMRLPYNLNSLSQAAASYCLDHYELISRQVTSIVQLRETLFADLDIIDGIQVYPSATNFLLLRVGDADALHSGLRQKGILVKNLHGSDPMLENCLRVTVGTEQENSSFIDALRELC